MSEPLPNSPEELSIPDQPELTQEEKVVHIKNSMLATLNKLYVQLVAFIDQSPFSGKLKEFSIMNLDQGRYWADQGIRAMQFTVEKPAEPEKEQTEEASPEATNEAQPTEGATPC